MDWLSAATIGSSVLGGLFGKSGQSAANAANARQAALNRQFQRNMSNTAYQRAAKDLDAAGLNRILAIGSPASTPGGAQARFENENSKLQEGIQSGISQTISAKLASANIENIKARTAYTEAQTNALTPLSELGKETYAAKERATQFYEKARDNIKWGPPKADDNMTPSLQKRMIGEIAKSVGLKPDAAIPLLMQTLNRMDLPIDWTDQQKLNWALKNPDKIKAYLKRAKR